VRWPRSICDYENEVKRVFLIWWTLTSLISSNKLTCRPVYLSETKFIAKITAYLSYPAGLRDSIGYPCVLPYQFCEVLFWISWELLILCQAIWNTIKSVSSELSTGLVEVGFKAVISPFLEIKYEQFLLTRCNVFGISLYFSNKSMIGFI